MAFSFYFAPTFFLALACFLSQFECDCCVEMTINLIGSDNDIIVTETASYDTECSIASFTSDNESKWLLLYNPSTIYDTIPMYQILVNRSGAMEVVSDPLSSTVTYSDISTTVNSPQLMYDANLTHNVIYAWDGYNTKENNPENLIYIKIGSDSTSFSCARFDNKIQIIDDIAEQPAVNPKILPFSTNAYLVLYEAFLSYTGGWCIRLLSTIGTSVSTELHSCRKEINNVNFDEVDTLVNVDYTYMTDNLYTIAYVHYYSRYNVFYIFVCNAIITEDNITLSNELSISAFEAEFDVAVMLHGIERINVQAKEISSIHLPYLTLYSTLSLSGDAGKSTNITTLYIQCDFSAVGGVPYSISASSSISFEVNNRGKSLDANDAKLIDIPATEYEGEIFKDVFAVVFPNITVSGRYQLFVRFFTVHIFSGPAEIEWISDSTRVCKTSSLRQVNICVKSWMYDSVLSTQFLVAYVRNCGSVNECQFNAHLWEWNLTWISPSFAPTHQPISTTYSPTNGPTIAPTIQPTIGPTIKPTNLPTKIPTYPPSYHPTLYPSNNQTNQTAHESTYNPTVVPSHDPSISHDPTQMPSQNPVVHPTIDPTSNPLLLINETQTISIIEQNATASYTESIALSVTNALFTQSVFIVIIVVLSILLVITVLAHFHNISHLPCFWATDDAEVGALLAFALQVWDFLSDINFTYELSTIGSSFSKKLFKLSMIFLFLPWLLNISWLLIQRRRWGKHAIVNLWIRDYAWFLMALSMISGGANASIKLCNSRLFGLEVFSLELPKYEYVKLSKWPIMLSIFFENIPQMVVQWMYLSSDSDSNLSASSAAVFSLISSVASILFATLVLILRCSDPFNDCQFAIHLTIPGKQNEDSIQLQNRLGNRIAIAVSIASILEIRSNMIVIDRITHGYEKLIIYISIAGNFSVDNAKSQRERDDMREEHIDTLLHAMNTARNNGRFAEILKGVLRLRCLPIVEKIADIDIVDRDDAKMELPKMPTVGQVNIRMSNAMKLRKILQPMENESVPALDMSSVPSNSGLAIVSALPSIPCISPEHHEIEGMVVEGRETPVEPLIDDGGFSSTESDDYAVVPVTTGGSALDIVDDALHFTDSESISLHQHENTRYI